MVETGEKWDSPSLSLSHPDSPGFRPQATAHVLLQILVKKLKWIHEWSDGTHGVSAVAKCATTTIRVAASSPLVRASVVRLTTTRHHRGEDLSAFRPTDRLGCLLSSNFSFLFFSSLPFFPLSFETEKLFEERREAKGIVGRKGTTVLPSNNVSAFPFRKWVFFKRF